MFLSLQWDVCWGIGHYQLADDERGTYYLPLATYYIHLFNRTNTAYLRGIGTAARAIYVVPSRSKLPFRNSI